MTALAGSVTLPGLGTISKKNAAIYGVVAAGVVGIAVMRYRRSQAVAPVSDTDGDTNEATGYDYGSASDEAALANYGTAGGQYGSAFGSGYTGSSPDDTEDADQPTTGFSNNAQWTQAGVDFLSGTVGLDAAPVSAALGKYIAGQGVTAAQKNLIEQAIAAVGQAPQSGVNGFPPSIRYVPTSVRPKLANAGTEIVRNAKESAITWTAVANATSYRVWSNQHGLLKELKTRRVVIPKSAKSQQIWIIARNPGGGYPDSAKSNVVTVPALPKPKPKPRKPHK